MKIKYLIRPISFITIFCSIACNSDSTTTGRPNKGGAVTSDKSADQQRGGTSGDWSQGTGQPGSAPSSPPQRDQNK